MSYRLRSQESFFNQGQSVGGVFPAEQKTESTNGHATLPSSDFSSKSTNVESVIAKIEGTPYFSMDVADLDVKEEEMNNSFKELKPSIKDGKKLGWGDPRVLMTTMSSFDGAVYAEARSMTD
ncbi:hypothetical protein K435DRAFT_973602 [Dendrothele bispora CBS 962.96]|uniref:Uncharacterized protein n=1 Tax=Dendrothele bispora (strain CBS 962.96) TaxID=1314807 RepID=A0A4S8KR59_DENBC|nr:hypothetical protein K435DRAFT_973602 [Dendrothele bispora CBS 962.96]